MMSLRPPKASAEPQGLCCAAGLGAWLRWKSRDAQSSVDTSEEETADEMGASGFAAHLLAGTSTDVESSCKGALNLDVDIVLTPFGMEPTVSTSLPFLAWMPE